MSTMAMPPLFAGAIFSRKCSPDGESETYGEKSRRTNHRGTEDTEKRKGKEGNRDRQDGQDEEEWGIGGLEE